MDPVQIPHQQAPWYPPPGPYTQAPPARPRFARLAWSGLILGIIGAVGMSIPILNILTGMAASVGFFLSLIALFGARKLLAGISATLCVLAVLLTGMAQKAFIEGWERATTGTAATSVLHAAATTKP